jgi:hypothetical protein
MLLGIKRMSREFARILNAAQDEINVALDFEASGIGTARACI